MSTYPKTFSHVGISVPNLEAAVTFYKYYPDEKPFKMVYVEDPFGLVFEIYTHSYELTYSHGAY